MRKLRLNGDDDWAADVAARATSATRNMKNW